MAASEVQAGSSMVLDPTWRLAMEELEPASEEAHEQLYDLLTEAAAERAVPTPEKRDERGEEEAA